MLNKLTRNTHTLHQPSFPAAYNPACSWSLHQIRATQAILAYDDMPRTQWIFKFSAQNTIVVTRTFFTQEVNEAFEELEEGELGPCQGFDKLAKFLNFKLY